MKPVFAVIFLLTVGCLFFGACERHSFDETKKLQDLQRPHGDHGGEHDEEGDGKAH
jgi:hypothetical protein